MHSSHLHWFVIRLEVSTPWSNSGFQAYDFLGIGSPKSNRLGICPSLERKSIQSWLTQHSPSFLFCHLTILSELLKLRLSPSEVPEIIMNCDPAHSETCAIISVSVFHPSIRFSRTTETHRRIMTCFLLISQVAMCHDFQKWLWVCHASRPGRTRKGIGIPPGYYGSRTHANAGNH
jgi:hypothetical protein